MTRVVHVVNIDVGVRIHLKNQLLYLREQGYDVSAICSPGPLVPGDGTTPEGIPVYTVPMSRDIRPWQDLLAVAQLVRLFRQERFDIVHTHSVKPGLLGRLAARLAGTPCIVHTVHGLLLHEGMTRRHRWLWKASEMAGAAFGDYMLSQSRQDMAILLREGICNQQTLGYLGNGIDLSPFNPARITPGEVRATRQAWGVTEADKVMAIVGRLLADKGYRKFTEMARLVHKDCPKTRFWVIGRMETDRPDGLAVEDMITGDMSEYVSFLGLRSDMPQLYAAMDIFVFPSYHEGMPRSLMEAAAMGKAIVASDIRGCREVIEHGVTGLLVPVRDAHALAEAVKSLLDDPATASRLGAAARAYALEHFDERFYFERLHTAYQMLLDRQGRRLNHGSSQAD